MLLFLEKHWQKEWTIFQGTEHTEKIKIFGKKSVRIKNPPAHISYNLWNTVKNAFSNLEKNSLRIEVDGEEDLAALPAILFAPRDVTIIYGLPNKGVVVVKSTIKNKRKVREVLDKMCVSWK